MQIRIVNIAQKLPAWVDAACDDYLRRMPREITPEIVTVPLASRRARQSAQRQQARESELMLGKLAPGSLNLALDEGGETWSSRGWSRQLDRWMLEYPRVNFLIGGIQQHNSIKDN